MARRRKNPNRKTQNLRKQASAEVTPPVETNVRVFVYQTTRRKEGQKQTERSKSDE